MKLYTKVNIIRYSLKAITKPTDSVYNRLCPFGYQKLSVPFCCGLIPFIFFPILISS